MADQLELDSAQFVWGANDLAARRVEHVQVLECGRLQVKPVQGSFKSLGHNRNLSGVGVFPEDVLVEHAVVLVADCDQSAEHDERVKGCKTSTSVGASRSDKGGAVAVQSAGIAAETVQWEVVGQVHKAVVTVPHFWIVGQ